MRRLSYSLGAAILGSLGIWVAAGLSQVAWGDGAYLYGEANTRDEIGKTYLVFAAAGNRLEGAIYMPYSSFDCFQGTIHDRQLVLTIADSFDGQEYRFTIPIAATDPKQPPQLAGFYELKTLSDNDQRILQQCRQALRSR
ncbi:hypothetical protein [Synechococcus elongatus]|uniref:Uncharacterized protein n=1 Tax=Synechococcus elongatus PCC 11802 TaxID=2283154 RepID=A0AAU6R569_SYNEL|nr:hypothetical protein [Synechococcus elongatus]QFZ93047.1 hypothetical protein EKO22_12675 [Synechococcus elongatus PCC 11802]